MSKLFLKLLITDGILFLCWAFLAREAIVDEDSRAWEIPAMVMVCAMPVLALLSLWAR
jgi:hypothetical protein